ncbi:hypothetical protein B0A48_18454 [Cryoendolithus antarcticus]|uniref:ubiquitinyl hydrolase 1 n=1 Tax=Cryoendolithus antarcticus TaxID=1507870 RepID=A0A1V8S989_9PEZI|nr:hypothetical protein B0A48_18454 [Cryoendolithus antarcticus]
MFSLQQLVRKRWSGLPQQWKEAIVEYGLALAAQQRAERIVELVDAFRHEDLFTELCNPGHTNWDPMKSPESLLLEVESGIIIREGQEQIAASMRDPPEGRHAVMQMNMGEGKSSVIVPVAAVALANGKQLSRVIVAKPQSKQMVQMLISKLGGLLDRRVYHMPFSRSLKLDNAAASTPEHILSFRLMALECFISGRDDIGGGLMLAQDFFNWNSRDIVDESDENFSVHFELIYTMGMQRSIELSPERWLLLQQVMDIGRLLAPAIAAELPLSLEYHPSVSGSFARLRILRPDARAVLSQRLAERICEKGLEGFQISRQPVEIRRAVCVYITKTNLSPAEVDLVERSLSWTETTKSPLLLIRGMIAGGILGFALGQKRWRVNYGLASRSPPTQVAVPYRAKDQPSPRSEISHPDVVITLTSLCYYYSGLSDEDLFTTMGHLIESDQSDTEYQVWVRDAHALPAAFTQLQGINLKDRPQCIAEVFPAFRFAKSVVDYFLSHLVFPKEMKEFPDKLSTSGWEIAKQRRLPVTGFSGINDSRCLLRIDIDHLDLPEQRQTNARVLEHVLQPQNGVVLLEPASQDTSDAQHLLNTVLSLRPHIQVILDVGAQILELDNLGVAKTWLSMHDATKEAAVFVNDSDELCVIDRNDRVDLLRTSSFLNRLDSCLIFLDQARTRGIDLRLPMHYRAAVSLGAGLTKDQLVQACMRMRKLGRGQSVVFCVPQEIQVKILEFVSKTQVIEIDVADVIIWSISETWKGARRSMPLWTVQGKRFLHQESLWAEISDRGRMALSRHQAEKFLEDEAQSLDNRHRPRQTQSQVSSLAKTTNSGLQRILERCRQFGDLGFNCSSLQEEQERELSPEIEQERQVQRALPAQPAPHALHQDVRIFAMTGMISPDSKAYTPAFEALQDCSAAKDFSPSQLTADRKLFVTTDFIKTINSSGESYVSDAFQRPVQWLLTSRTKDSDMVGYVIIISPYEANQLYNEMRSTTASTLHIYKPRCNSGYQSLDRLDFHTVSAKGTPPVVPRALGVQFGLLAGQLYLSSYEDYQAICSFLGLCADALTEEMSAQGWTVAANGFILSDDQGRAGGGSGVEDSPVNFPKIFMTKIRRNGESIAKTHIGSLLKGKLFTLLDIEE